MHENSHISHRRERTRDEGFSMMALTSARVCAGEMNRGDAAGRNVTEAIEQLISFFAFSSRIKFI